jgi:glycerophosphoryl diester phosphodiesterase
MPIKKCLAILSLLSVIQCSTPQQSKPTYNYENCDFELVGHRGYADIYPENTLLSIEEAFKRGVKYCEIDINVTSDDVYVLFHDQPTMYRTSSGKGYIVSSTYEELLKLDFGSWKGSQFKGTKIATLEEALLLAEKYDAYLYLDTKKFRVDLMGKALQNVKVNPKRLMPAIASIEEAKVFKKYCPDSSFIYFGGFPENPNDDNWYKELVDLGCTIFESYYTFALDNNENFKLFVEKVHQYNAKVWVFTSNNLEEIKKIKNANVDGVESDIATSALKAICDTNLLKISPIKATTGNWNFEQKNLIGSGIGSQLRPFNYENENIIQPVTYGTTSSFGINSINGFEAKIIKIPAFNPKNGLFLFTNFIPYKDEDLHYDYSLILDVYMPKKSEGKFISLLQTSVNNSNDGDFFINDKGVGTNNNYHGKLQSETWYRLGIVVTKNSIKKYINGKFVGENSISGGRWSVYNVFSGGQDHGFLLFADDDNETAELFVNAIQLRNYAMNASEVSHLNSPNANGIPISNSGIYALKFENEIKESIVNWDKKEIYVTFPENADLSKVEISFKIPYGSKSSIKTGERVNLNQRNSKSILVTAQDGVTKTNWSIVPY